MKTEKLIREIRYLKTENGGLKAVVSTRRRVFAAALSFRGETLPDSFNDREPYDRRTHVFYLPAVPEADETLAFSCKQKPKNKRQKTFGFRFGEPAFEDLSALREAADSRITPVTEERHEIADGIVHTHLICKDKNGAPVHVH